MSSFRKDPFGEAWVLMSPERGLQPSDFGSAEAPAADSPLVPGREGELPGEIQALRSSRSRSNAPDWRARVVPVPGSLFGSRPFVISDEGPYAFGPASGYQELIVEHADPSMTLEVMPREHLVAVLRLYRDRLAFLADRPDIAHVQLTRNVGRAAGALYDHPHALAVALPVPNRWVEEEAAASQAHHDLVGRCLFCDVIAYEQEQRERMVTSNEHFVAIAPWAAKTPFETWIVPREHASAFTATPSNRLDAFAEILQNVLRTFGAALDHPPYNLILHTRPRADDASYHWHVELLPRLTRQAGFDWGSGYFVNPTPPEDAARMLRQASSLFEVET